MSMSVDTNTILARAEYEHWWFQSRRAITGYVFWKKLPKTQEKLKILSVGCGTGAELEHIGQFGEVTGIDIDPEVVQFCRAKGLNVVQMNLLDLSFAAETFDIVVAMDVLEHIKEDYKALEKLEHVLKKNGLLLITVPALQCLWSSFDEEGEFPHVRRYTKKSLLSLIGSQKLIPEKISYYNFFLFPLAYFTRKSDKSFASQMVGMPAWQNTILRLIFSFEKYFLPWISFPVGVSLIGVFKKR